MFRNQYDNDITVFSPQGRIHQIEYAIEAVKQGSPCVGLKSKTHSIVAVLNRAQSELASTQNKLFRVDDHIGFAVSGLVADANIMSTYLRQFAIKSKLVFDRPAPVSRAVEMIADKAQVNTQKYGNRPYGVGLLVIGYDETGPHLYECTPAGNYFDFYAQSIGARSQSAKTYLESNFQEFPDCDLDHLVLHALRALRETLQQDKQLNVSNCSIAIVGKDLNYHKAGDVQLQGWLDLMDVKQAAGDADVVAMEQD